LAGAWHSHGDAIAAIDVGGGVVDQWPITGRICALMLAVKNWNAKKPGLKCP